MATLNIWSSQFASKSNMADVPIDCDFPVWGLLPKKETGVVSFLNKYEEYDGRNTVIAILDSGVDPAAEGLKVTSTGEVKVIERFDCSGCGDVDTTTIRKVSDGIITGLTGRKLKIPESWKNPSGVWRVGMLYPYSLYPTKLKERMQTHRKENIWDISHKLAFAEANKKLQEFEAEIATKNSSSLTLEEKAKKDELEARVDVLQNAEKKYNDVGPTYDCILFNDGEVWRACIDTSECGELTKCPLLGEYSITHEHTHLTPIDEMTISINVHDKGDVLEVVGMCSTHGTHVAAIAAGYFPEEPDKNGVAPGAKVVSLTIGDSRLGSMETGTALVRACVKIMELSATTKVDVVNMSYGEHAHWSNAGRVGSVICSVVNGYGVSWVVSGGNHGPALCTVGAPPDVAQSVLVGVGAYVSADMMAAAYSMRARAPAGAFSWSSRGPCADGALGVSVCAPGGAVASVARFTLRNCQLMNGTSMAAPHVAGVAALLVSGLKARRLPYSPYSVKRALENSATFLPHVEPWAQGAGLVNVEKAFEILSAYHDAPERDVSFGVTCGVYGGKGVLLRPTDDSPRDVTVTVEPQFQRAPPSGEADAAVIATQLALRLRLTLTCAASWVSTPKHLDMMNASRPFVVRIDVASLPPGPHFASIDAYDVSCVEKGPVFRVPVTVLKAEPLAGDAGTPRLSCQRVVFRPGDIRRHLIAAPATATWGVVRMQRSGGESAGRFLLHALQMLPRRSCRSHETQKLVTLSAEAPAATPFQVRGDALLEVAIAKYWASTGDVEVDYSIELFGVRPDFGPRLSFHAAEGIREVCVRTLRLQEVQPSVQLKHMEAIIRPSESKLTPLSPRDVVPPSRQIYQLLNTYSFHLAKATEVSPMVTMLNDMLYESEFESQMWMLYNSCKQLMAVGDAYPSKYSVKLEKGEYVVRVSIRHEQRQQLERLQELPLVVQQRLAQPLALDVYASQSQALVAGKKCSPVLLPAGVSLPLYVAAAPVDKITRSCLTLGHTLSGTMSFAKDEAGRKVDTYPIQYVVCEMPRRNNNNSVAGNNKPKSQEDFSDAYKDFVTGWLPKLEGENLEQVYAEAMERFPEYAGVHVAYLNALDSPTDPAKLPHVGETPDAAAVNAQRIITIADKVVQQIELAKVLAQQGAKHDTRPDAAKARQEQERARAQLLDALCRRGTALCRSGAAAAALHDNATDVLKLADLSDSKVIQYGVWHYFTLEQWGRAIKLLNKMQEERPSKETEERLIEAYRKLGWDYLAHYSEASIPIRFPSSYRPF